MQGFLKIRDRLRVLKCNGADGTPSLHSGGRGTVGVWRRRAGRYWTNPASASIVTTSPSALLDDNTLTIRQSNGGNNSGVKS